ncbi:hypothetical protein B0H34DRAFT_757442 [Crassisporium funariophilum]|nr:hypothetical protein B0H34DRAFT_757442 [Crassisporium funariophilum]
MPCAPFLPTTAISLQTLEVFRVTHLHSPHLSIHLFVKSICNMHGVPFKPYLYLSIRAGIEARVFAALRRDGPDWRLKHACPPCIYILEGELELKFSMLYTVDGNDSLKRIIQRDPAPAPIDTDALGESAPTASQAPTASEPILGESSKGVDTRQVGKGIYLTREQVDQWCKEIMEGLVPGYDEDNEENPCAERWRNMKVDLTKKMWGVFEETGLFLALCRHGFVLLLADMVRSGELSKYPLAIVAKMLEVFGKDLGLGYDIGCRFATTIRRSLLGKDAARCNHRCLVGTFHGHAHNRLCQSRFLAIYVAGLGLEDLEGCERCFAKSNALASSIRYMSVYHCRQAIWEYFRHTDKFETYQNLSTFLLNNYKQALALLDTRPAVAAALKKLGAEDEETVEGWLKEEGEYLQGLSKEPLQETREMEYYKLLMVLCKSELLAASQIFSIQTPSTIGLRDKTASQETAQRHSMESHRRDLLAVQLMEKQMDIEKRWTPECKEWEATRKMVSRRRYQHCIDTLEGLVVACMFELTKMNMSQTGYSLRKHIANALKARSTAIRVALVKYNAAAAALCPEPGRELSWEEVVEYAFLANFNLLRDTRQDIRKKDWAKPAARYAMDQYFKVKHAEEEILHLNVEIPRLATFIRDDEEASLLAQEAEIRFNNPHLAHQVTLY